jgi:hypothetical protein
MLTKGDNNMAFQLSPGINVSEIDLTTVVPAVSSTTGAIAGVFTWGPTGVPTLVSSETDLVNRFGTPVSGHNQETFFTAADFLAYGNALYVVRVDTGNTATTESGATWGTAVSAKYKGSYGNKLAIAVVGSSGNTATLDTAGARYYAGRLRAPEANTFNVVVMDTVANVAVEVYESLSTTSTAKNADGSTNYLSEVIRQKSKYITITDDASTAIGTVGTSLATYEALSVGGDDGDDENTVTASAITDAYDTLVSPEDVDISLILAGVARGTNGVEVANYISENIVDVRKDCVLFVSPEKADVVNATGSELSNVTEFSDALASSSYIVLDSGYKYRYDRYNDLYIYTPLNGDIAGLCARTDNVRDPWFSPAGYNRGNIKNIIKLAYNPKKADRDELYKNSINPVITEPGQGTILFGDKTHLARPSAFDRINVRRLFIVLEKAIARASKSTLFEFNDEFTRAQFRNLIEPFLRDVQGRRGILDFKVVCDETNNTAEVIDRNEFIGDIYVKPARSINFIQLNFVAVRSGVEFEEIIGQR